MDLKTLFALLTTIFFWSSAFVAIRACLHDFHPGALALLRYLTASIAMAPIYFSLRKRIKVRRQDWPLFFLTGATGFTIYNLALNQGEVTVSAGIASFIVGLIPVFTILMAVVFLKEKIKRKSLIGVSVSFFGIFIIAISEYTGLQFNMGVIYSLLAAICASVYAILQKILLKRYPPLQVAAIAIWLGTLMLSFYMPTLYHEILRADRTSTISAMYMGVFPGVVAYVAWSYALSRVPASQASTAVYSMPLVTTLIGYFYLGEIPSLYSLVGGLIALIGAIQVNRVNQKPSNLKLTRESA